MSQILFRYPYPLLFFFLKSLQIKKLLGSGSNLTLTKIRLHVMGLSTQKRPGFLSQTNVERQSNLLFGGCPRLPNDGHHHSYPLLMNPELLM